MHIAKYMHQKKNQNLRPKQQQSHLLKRNQINGAVSNFSNQTSTGSGTAGDLAGTILTSGAVTVTAGGAGTVATGQFVNELTIQ